MEKRGRKGQIWVETVVYTLIGLAIISAILAIVTPRITKTNDSIIVSQTIEALNGLNEQVRDSLSSAGSQREVLLSVKKGEYFIDSPNDNIYFFLKGTGYKYSQPGVPIKQGDITIITTEKLNDKYDLSLMLNYSSFNITYSGKDVNKTLTTAPVAYRFIIVNKGSAGIDEKTQLDIQPIGG